MLSLSASPTARFVDRLNHCVRNHVHLSVYRDRYRLFANSVASVRIASVSARFVTTVAMVSSRVHSFSTRESLVTLTTSGVETIDASPYSWRNLRANARSTSARSARRTSASASNFVADYEIQQYSRLTSRSPYLRWTPSCGA